MTIMFTRIPNISTIALIIIWVRLMWRPICIIIRFCSVHPSPDERSYKRNYDIFDSILRYSFKKYIMIVLQLKHIIMTCHLHFHPFSTLASGLFLWCAGSWPASKDHYVQLLSSHQHPNTLCLHRTSSPHYQSFGSKNWNLVTNLQRSLHTLHFDAEVIQDVLKGFNEML